MVSGLGELLVTLIRMIVHGHGDKDFAQYSNELWPNDPNFTLGHFCVCFIALKRSQLGSHGFYLSSNPNTHSSNKFCKEVSIV
jgi:hypothetical protein